MDIPWWMALIIGLVVIVFISEFMEHRSKWRKMTIELEKVELEKAKLQLKQAASEDVPKQLEALKKEIADLRQTSTEYCLSLDANLQTLQQRLSFLEGRLQEIEQVKRT